jgi:hypothetical protein
MAMSSGLDRFTGLTTPLRMMWATTLPMKGILMRARVMVGRAAIA